MTVAESYSWTSKPVTHFGNVDKMRKDEEKDRAGYERLKSKFSEVGDE